MTVVRVGGPSPLSALTGITFNFAFSASLRHRGLGLVLPQHMTVASRSKQQPTSSSSPSSSSTLPSPTITLLKQSGGGAASHFEGKKVVVDRGGGGGGTGGLLSSSSSVAAAASAHQSSALRAIFEEIEKASAGPILEEVVSSPVALNTHSPQQQTKILNTTPSTHSTSVPLETLVEPAAPGIRGVLTGIQKFEIGQCITHRAKNYRGIVYGVDAECKQNPTWMQSRRVDELRDGRSQPFYFVITDVRDDPATLHYVPEENLIAQRPTDPDIRHPLLEKLFSGFDQKTGRYIPRDISAASPSSSASSLPPSSSSNSSKSS